MPTFGIGTQPAGVCHLSRPVTVTLSPTSNVDGVTSTVNRIGRGRIAIGGAGGRRLGGWLAEGVGFEPTRTGIPP